MKLLFSSAVFVAILASSSAEERAIIKGSVGKPRVVNFGRTWMLNQVAEKLTEGVSKDDDGGDEPTDDVPVKNDDGGTDDNKDTDDSTDDKKNTDDSTDDGDAPTDDSTDDKKKGDVSSSQNVRLAFWNLAYKCSYYVLQLNR